MTLKNPHISLSPNPETPKVLSLYRIINSSSSNKSLVMMNRVSAYLNRPATYNAKPWTVLIVATLIVGFLLTLFQPFGIGNITTPKRYYIIAGFMLVTAISTFIVGYVLPLIFKRFYNPAKWTIGKGLLVQVILFTFIGMGNFIFDWCLTNRPYEIFFSVLLAYLLATLILGAVPAAISFFIVQNSILRQNLKDAHIINEQLSKRFQPERQTEGYPAKRSDGQSGKHPDGQSERQSNENRSLSGTITLSGSTKESVTLHPDNILYLESIGNYIKVVYLAGDNVKSKQLRNTLGQMEQELKSYSGIVRCHRAYMANFAFVTSVEGNSQGLQLHLRHINETLPVSRSYIKSIREQL